jgi:DNA replication protein DnaC
VDELIYKLKSLRLSGVTPKLNIRIQEAIANELSYLEFLNNLIEDELTVRQDRLLNRRLKQARFPDLKTIADFDFAFNPSINKQQIKKLTTTALCGPSAKCTVDRPARRRQNPSGCRLGDRSHSQRFRCCLSIGV